MKTTLSKNNYQHAQVEQQEHLHAFRATHPCEQIDLSGTTWSYLLGGKGAETIVILPGGERKGDIAFPLMQQFEQEYRCLYPSYPSYSTMDALVAGLAALLGKLSIDRVILFAASLEEMSASALCVSIPIESASLSCSIQGFQTSDSERLHNALSRW